MRYSLIPDGTILSTDAMQRVNGVGDWSWTDFYHDVLHAGEDIAHDVLRPGSGGTGSPAGGGAPAGGASGGGGTTTKPDNTWLWLAVAGAGAVLLFMTMKRR